MDLMECRPLGLLAVPAFDHQVVSFLRTVAGLRQADLLTVAVEVVSAVLDDLFVRQVLVRLYTSVRQDFPQRHAEGPDLTPCREFSLIRTNFQLSACFNIKCLFINFL